MKIKFRIAMFVICTLVFAALNVWAQASYVTNNFNVVVPLGGFLTIGQTIPSTSSYTWDGPNGFSSSAPIVTVTSTIKMSDAGIYSETGHNSIGGITGVNNYFVTVDPSPETTVLNSLLND
jgi:hypothetical protein